MCIAVFDVAGSRLKTAMTAGRTAAVARLLPSVLLAIGLAGCASRAPRQVAQTSVQTSAQTSAQTSVQAPVLQALPSKATLAWVRPNVLFADATSDDDESAGTGAARLIRLDIEVLLKGQGWALTSADSADFVASVAIATRTTWRTEERNAPGGGTLVQVCDQTRTNGRCHTVVQPATVTVRVPVSEGQALFGMRRRQDGARREWVSGTASSRDASSVFLKELIAMLRPAAAKQVSRGGR